MYEIDENYFSKIDSIDKAYFLGLLYADGNVHIKNSINHLSIELLLEDLKIIDLFKICLKTNRPLKFRKSKIDKNGFKIKERCGLNITNRKICSDLVSLGCVPRKTKILKFPQFIKNNNSLLKAFIRGYFDGDGCVSISKQNKIKSSISSTEDFILNLNDIFTNLGLNPKIYKSKKISNFYEIYFHGIERNIKMYNYIYDDSIYFLNRKKEKFENFLFRKVG
jgi:intein/homing endonuclease